MAGFYSAAVRASDRFRGPLCLRDSRWNDFNDAQSNTNLIPKGTLAKVRLTIRPGGFDDLS